MKWKCFTCPTKISGNTNRKYCGECLRTRRKVQMNVANHRQSYKTVYGRMKKYFKTQVNII